MATRLEEGERIPLLQVEKVSKKYGENVVLNEVSFSLDTGTVHGVIGQNGAGKSTLVGIISGIVVPDIGEVRVSDTQIEIGNPRAALSAGIATVYQELSLLPELAVYENMFLGDELVINRRLASSEMIKRTNELLSGLGGYGIDATSRTWRLSLAQRQIVEIARCVRRNVKVLILDEPSAVLGSNEISTLFDLIKRLNSRGTGVIYISHRLAEVEQVSDQITVLRDGQTALVQLREKFDRSQMVRAMIGAETSSRQVSLSQNYANKEFSVDRLKLHKNDKDGISFTLSAGEILGVAGHTGSGRSRLLKGLAGLGGAFSGTIRLDGVTLDVKDLKKLKRLSVRYLPEDRKKLGLFLDRSIRENIIISDIKALSKFGFLSFRKINSLAQEFFEKLRIRAQGLDQIVSRLSGGNQQKVLLARTMLSAPQVLLLDEPLRGVDVGAKSEIVDAIKSHVALGNIALVVSSELADIISLTNKILILKNGNAHSLTSKLDLDENELAIAVENT